MPGKSVTACCEALIEKKLTISFVESASAGKISYDFSTVINSGQILMGGLVCYHESVKENLLNIPKEIIEKNTAESAIVTQLMAKNFHNLVKSDICVALTGLTTPGGSESPEKPVGTIFLHFIFPHKEIAKKYRFQGTAQEIVQKSIDAIAEIVTNEVLSS